VTKQPLVVNESTLHADARRFSCCSQLRASLQAAGTNASAINNGGSTALHWACSVANGDISTSLIRLLLSRGLSVDAANRAGETPLHWAVDWSRPHAVDELLNQGANANLKDVEGNTPMHKIKMDCHEKEESVAIRCTHHSCELEAPVITQSVSLLRLIILCAHSSLSCHSLSCTAIVSRLLKGGADVGIKNNFNRVALQYFNQDKELQTQQQQQQLEQRMQREKERAADGSMQPSTTHVADEASTDSTDEPRPTLVRQPRMTDEQIAQIQQEFEEFKKNMTEGIIDEDRRQLAEEEEDEMEEVEHD
jgi:hypothetical protein